MRQNKIKIKSSELDAQSNEKKIIDAEKLSLKDWLGLLKERPEDETWFIDYMFPSNRHRKEFLDTINSRTDDEINLLLHNFLWDPTTFGSDESNARKADYVIKNRIKSAKILEIEHRFLLWKVTKGRLPVWDGTRWVLDLLPQSPKMCIDVLTAFLTAYNLILPDGRFDGVLDAMDLIRKKYITTVRKGDEFDAIDCREMEKLIYVLYKVMGYETKLTPKIRDGGYDVIINSKKIGQREKTLIEVKHHNNKIGVDIVRQLMGVVSTSFANKGILITTSTFTKGAKDIASKDPRIELIDGNSLLHLLNEYLGTDWHDRLYRIIMACDRDNET